jgi:hypothetical protein
MGFRPNRTALPGAMARVLPALNRLDGISGRVATRLAKRRTPESISPLAAESGAELRLQPAMFQSGDLPLRDCFPYRDVSLRLWRTQRQSMRAVP